MNQERSRDKTFFAAFAKAQLKVSCSVLKFKVVMVRYFSGSSFQKIILE